MGDYTRLKMDAIVKSTTPPVAVAIVVASRSTPKSLALPEQWRASGVCYAVRASLESIATTGSGLEGFKKGGGHGDIRLLKLTAN